MSTEAVSEIVDTIIAPPSTEAVPTTAEQTAETQPAQPTTDPRVSSKLETLIKREQAALARERMAKQKEAEIEAKLARIAEFESVKKNPKKALEFLELDYDQLTQTMLNDGNMPAEVQIQKLREEWEAEKRAREVEKERLAQDEKQKTERELQKKVEEFKGEITTYLKDNAAKYELIAFEGQEDLVYGVIDEHYNRTINPETGVGKVMSIADAADKVEKHLEQKYEKSREVNKVKALWGNVPKDAQQKLVSELKRQAPQQSTRTLTNQLSATPSAPRTRPITDEERVAKAIAYARGIRP